MSVEEIEDAIVEFLAADARCSIVEMWGRLREGGPELPVDSLLAAEIVARLAERVGVELPATAETAQALRSVRRFAVAVHELLPPERVASELSA